MMTAPFLFNGPFWTIGFVALAEPQIFSKTFCLQGDTIYQENGCQISWDKRTKISFI